MVDPNMNVEVKEATEYKPIPEDVYAVELLDVNAKENETYDSKVARQKDSTLEPEMETVFDFQFVLLEGKDGEEDLRGRNVFMNFVPAYLYIGKNGKNKLYQVVEALQGEVLSPKQEAEGITGSDLNALVGKQCRVGTTNTTKGDKTYSNIDKFLVAKGDFDPLTAEEKEKATIKPKESEQDKAAADAAFEGQEAPAEEDNAQPPA